MIFTKRNQIEAREGITKQAVSQRILAGKYLFVRGGDNVKYIVDKEHMKHALKVHDTKALLLSLNTKIQNSLKDSDFTTLSDMEKVDEIIKENINKLN